MVSIVPIASALVETSMVSSDAARIFVRAQGSGPLLVLLPSQARDADDYDFLAQGFVHEGLRVLRPQPRGIGASAGPLEKISLRDFAQDIAAVIDAQNAGPAVVFGHAFGHYVARMTAQAFAHAVAGVIVAASAAKTYPAELSLAVTQAGDVTLPYDVRHAALRKAFFAPGNDPSCWLQGWYPHMQDVQRKARLALPQEDFWGAGDAPLLELQPEFDPFKPPERRSEMRDEFGERVSVALIRNASHALIPEQPEQVVAACVAWMRRIGHIPRSDI